MVLLLRRKPATFPSDYGDNDITKNEIITAADHIKAKKKNCVVVTSVMKKVHNLYRPQEALNNARNRHFQSLKSRLYS